MTVTGGKEAWPQRRREGPHGRLAGMTDWTVGLWVGAALGLVLLIGLIIVKILNENDLVWFDVIADRRPALILIATCLLIVVGVAMIVSWVVKDVRRDAALSLLTERLRYKRDLIISLQEQRHDFRNRLAVVLGMLQLGWEERAVSYLKTAIEPGDEGAPVRPLSGIDAFELFSSFLWHKVTHGVADNVSINMMIDTRELPAISTDELMRLGGNLIDNALEAASREPAGGKIEVRIAKEGTRWLFSVWNNGAWIREADLPHVCTPGFTTKDNGEGHGLGLASVHQIVTERHGSLDISSTQKDGTRFVVSLPHGMIIP